MPSKSEPGGFAWRERGKRLVMTAGIVGVAVLGLWQAGVLFRDPNENVTTTDELGETVLLEIRAADTSVETPGGPDLSIGAEKGQLAPNFEVSTLAGERVKLSDFRGKAVYLNFWASWCGPCRAEMPDIQAVLDEFNTQGLVVLAVNNGEAFAPADGFIEELDLRLTAVGMDPTRSVIEQYGVFSMPTSVFINADGVVTRVHPGLATAEQMEEFAREALGLSATEKADG